MISTFSRIFYGLLVSVLYSPERNWLEGEAMCRRMHGWVHWRVRSQYGRRRVHRHGVRQRRRWQRAVRRRRHVLQQLGDPRRSRMSNAPPPSWLLRLALCTRHTPFPLRLHRTVHIHGCILHLHYVHVHVHTGHVLSARLARNAHRDRVRLAQAGRGHGQPHIDVGAG